MNTYFRGSESDLFNRSKVILDEGRKRGITFEVLDGPMQCVRASYKSKSLVFSKIPIRGYSTISCYAPDSKLITKILFQEANIPVPHGYGCSTFQEAKAILAHIGYPLVVKPMHGSLSEAVSTNIRTKIGLWRAFHRARRKEEHIIVERYIPGHSFRITVVGGKVAGCVRRDRANVTGDGKSSILQLIQAKNRDPRRGNFRDPVSLYKIPKDIHVHSTLMKSGRTIFSIPPSGNKIWLRTEVEHWLVNGGEPVEETDLMHSDIIEISRKAAKSLTTEVIGLDFIAQDISRSWKDQVCGFIEANAYPYIDMHHYPYLGKPRNVAGRILDLIFPESKH